MMMEIVHYITLIRPNEIPFHSTQIVFKNYYRVKCLELTHKLHINEKSIHE